MYEESYAACARVIISFHLSVQQRCHGVVSILSYNAQPDIAIEFLTTVISILWLRHVVHDDISRVRSN